MSVHTINKEIIFWTTRMCARVDTVEGKRGKTPRVCEYLNELMMDS